jgi:hypothetical protein
VCALQGHGIIAKGDGRQEKGAHEMDARAQREDTQGLEGVRPIEAEQHDLGLLPCMQVRFQPYRLRSR